MPSRRAVLGMAAGAVLWPELGYAAAENPSPEAAAAYIRNLISEGIRALLGHGIDADERARRFHQFINRHIDRPGLPAAVLGRYWGRLTPEQREEYLRLFDDYLVLAYSPYLAEFPAGGEVVVIGADPAGEGRVVVHSESREPGAPPTRVDWLVVQGSDGRFRVTDVIAAGVSARETIAADYTGLIRAHSGKVEALLEALRRKFSAAK